MADDLAGLAARLQRILDPYRDRLEPVEVYGVPFLSRAGAKKHDWFAGVSPGNGVIRFFLLPMHAHPELLEGVPDTLRRRKTGASLFSFKAIDEEQATALERLVARSFTIYLPEEVTTRGRA